MEYTVIDTTRVERGATKAEATVIDVDADAQYPEEYFREDVVALLKTHYTCRQVNNGDPVQELAQHMTIEQLINVLTDLGYTVEAHDDRQP